MKTDKENILGHLVTAKTKDACVDLLLSWIESDIRGKYFVCANPHSLEVSRKDFLFYQALLNADLQIPDGIGIIIASKLLGGSLRKRITGSDIFLGLSQTLNKKNSYSYFFLGSTNLNLKKIEEKMKFDFPNIKVAGTYSPPFKPKFTEEDDRLMVEVVNRSRPDVLWVGMTAPKQEKWIYRNRDRLNVRVIGPIGAVFDFYIGNVKRPHAIFQKMGLEWLIRFLRDPWHLWERNLVSNPKFLLRVINCKLKNY